MKYVYMLMAGWNNPRVFKTKEAAEAAGKLISGDPHDYQVVRVLIED